MGRNNKISIIWTISKEELQKFVDESKTFKDLVKKLGFKNDHHPYLHERLNNDNIDYSKFYISWKDNRTNRLKEKIPTEQILVKNSKYRARKNLKKRLFKEELLKEQCNNCSLGPIWQNKPITLQLHHIDGDHYNNELSNLQILCPNCHSQTNTYARCKTRKICKNCDSKITKTNRSGWCRKCFDKQQKWIPRKCKACPKKLCFNNESGYCSECYSKEFRYKLASNFGGKVKETVETKVENYNPEKVTKPHKEIIQNLSIKVKEQENQKDVEMN